MKRIIAAVALCASCAFAGLEPDTFTLTWNRQSESAYINTNVYMSEVTYWLTNCLARIGIATQALDNCGVEIRVGDDSTNRLFIGWLEDTNNGQFGCAFTIPTRPLSTARGETMTAEIQFSITNNAGVRVTDKQRKKLYYRAPLR